MWCHYLSAYIYFKYVFSFSEADKRLLRGQKLHIVNSQWLDDSIEKNQKLPEESYNLKPQGFHKSLTEDG